MKVLFLTSFPLQSGLCAEDYENFAPIAIKGPSENLVVGEFGN
jgi:hypothetical protein